MLVNSKAYVSYQIGYKKEDEKTGEAFNETSFLEKLNYFDKKKDVLFKTEGLYHFENDLQPVQV